MKYLAAQGYRSGRYDRNLATTSGDATLHVPRLKGLSFETAIIERYRRREIRRRTRVVGDISERQLCPDAGLCSATPCR